MAEKKKPKPGPSTGGSSTSRIKKPKGTQPLTLGTGGLRTSKISKKQQAGTRKVVGAIAAVTPAARLATGAVKASRTTGIQGFGASMTPKQNFGRYAQLNSEVKSKTARKIGDKISGASSKKVQKKLNKYADADVKAGFAEPGWGNHPASLSYKGYQKVTKTDKFPTARQSVRWRKAEDKADVKSTKRALKSVNTKKYTKKK